MPSLTDSAVGHALKRVAKSRKQESLADGEGRGKERSSVPALETAEYRTGVLGGPRSWHWLNRQLHNLKQTTQAAIFYRDVASGALHYFMCDR